MSFSQKEELFFALTKQRGKRLMALKKLCRKAGCPNYRLEGHDYCEKHLSIEEERKQRALEYKDGFNIHVDNSYKDTFYNSHKWRTVRKNFLSSHQECAMCGGKSEVIHHDYPQGYDYFNARDFFNEDKFVPLCSSCHNRLTLEERKKRKKDYVPLHARKLWY